MKHDASSRLGILAVARGSACERGCSFGYNGEAWALRIDQATAKLLEKPE